VPLDPDLSRSFAAHLLLSARQAADYLSVHQTTVYALCKKGRLRFRHVDGVLRVSQNDLNRFMARNPRYRVGVFEDSGKPDTAQ
jgi:excisionase family DNA binding protein